MNATIEQGGRMDYNYDYYDTAIQSSNGDAAVSGAIIASIIFFFLLFTLIAYAVGAWLMSRIFKKAGVPQWIAWVPVYSNWKLLEIGGQRGFWAVFAFIPFIGITSLIFLYMAMYQIGKNLGKEGWFVLVAIFLPLVWLLWLAFDDSKWRNKNQDTTLPASKTL